MSSLKYRTETNRTQYLSPFKTFTIPATSSQFSPNLLKLASPLSQVSSPEDILDSSEKKQLLSHCEQLYDQIQSLNKTKESLMEEHKSKVIKVNETSQLISHELSSIGQQVEAIRITQANQQKYADKQRSKLDEEIASMQKQTKFKEEEVLDTQKQMKSLESQIKLLSIEGETDCNSKTKLRKQYTYLINQKEQCLNDIGHTSTVAKALSEQQSMLHEDIQARHQQSLHLNQKIERIREHLLKQYSTQFESYKTEELLSRVHTNLQENLSISSNEIVRINEEIHNKQRILTDLTQLQTINQGKVEYYKQQIEQQGGTARDGLSLAQVPNSLRNKLNAKIQEKQKQLVASKIKKLRYLQQNTGKYAAKIKQLQQLEESLSIGTQSSASNINTELAQMAKEIGLEGIAQINHREQMLQPLLKQITELKHQKKSYRKESNRAKEELHNLQQLLEQQMSRREHLQRELLQHLQTASEKEYPKEMKNQSSTMLYYQKLLEENNSIRIPILQYQSQVLSQQRGQYGQVAQKITKRLEMLEDQIAEEKDAKYSLDQNERAIVNLQIQLEHLSSKHQELSEYLSYNQKKLLKAQQSFQSISTSQADRVKAQQLETEVALQRQAQLLTYQGQIQNTLAPEVEKQKQQILSIEKQANCLKHQLIKYQQTINSISKQKDYQQLSGIQASSKLANTGSLVSKNQSYSAEMNQRNLNSEFTKADCIHTVDIHLSQQRGDVSEDLVTSKKNQQLPYKSSGTDFMIECPPGTEERFVSPTTLSCLNDIDKETVSKLKPLLTGIEVYRKQFDSRFVTAIYHQQRFEPLSNNQRVTPDLLGYSLRRVILSKDNFYLLEMHNSHDGNKVDTIIDIREARVSVPKVTVDSIKFQKESRCHSKQLVKASRQMTRKQFSTRSYTQIEQDKYRERCVNAQYYSISVAYQDKEFDIVVPGIGGFYNYLYFKMAIDALKGLGSKPSRKYESVLK